MVQSIPAKEIVQITPNVLNAGGSALDMVTLVLTQNHQVPIGTVQEFTTSDGVSEYFGPSSDEKALADVYFLGFDNSNVKPGSVLFAQYPSVAVAAYERGGDVSGLSLSALQAITGNLTISIDGYNRTGNVSTLSGATSFSNGATLIQTAVNGSMPTEATMTASIATTVLTVTVAAGAPIAVGQTVVGAGVAANTRIISLGTGTGGTGTYNLNNSQTVASEAMTTQPTPVTVTYDSISGGFVITSGITGVASLAGFASGPPAIPLMLTSATGAVISQGAAAAVPGPFMDGIVRVSQDWATFMTLFDPDGGSGNAVKLAFATWNDAQDNTYAYICWDTDASPTTQNPASTSLGFLIAQSNISGTFLMWEPAVETTYHHAAFAAGLGASIDFKETNGRTTYKFRSQSGLTPGVTDANIASNLEANGYNYYGSFATRNAPFIFLAPGQVSGNFQWMDSYIDQIWMNANFQLAFMNLLTQVKSIPYNQQGYSLIEAAAQDPINAAGNFGAFRPGVTLSQLQIAEVNNAAGKDIASTLQIRGWYFQVKDAAPSTRQARGSPPCTFWYVDGESVQKIDLASIELQ